MQEIQDHDKLQKEQEEPTLPKLTNLLKQP